MLRNLLCCWPDLIVHEEAIVKVKGVIVGVVHQPKQSLKALGVNGGSLQAHLSQHTAHRVCDELGACCEPVMLLAAHLHHAAALRCKELRPRHIITMEGYPGRAVVKS